MTSEQGDSLTEKDKGEEVSKSEQSEKGITEEEGLGQLSPSQKRHTQGLGVKDEEEDDDCKSLFV